MKKPIAVKLAEEYCGHDEIQKLAFVAGFQAARSIVEDQSESFWDCREGRYLSEFVESILEKLDKDFEE